MKKIIAKILIIGAASGFFSNKRSNRVNMQEKKPFFLELISSFSSSEDFQNKDSISIDNLISNV